MATVTLKQLRRLNTNGYIFERGVDTPVPYSVAMELQDNPRFHVKISPEEHARQVNAQQQAPAPVDTGEANQGGDQGEGEGAGQEEEAHGRPASEPDRLQAIREAAAELSHDEDSNWTNDGRPDARALTKALGWQVTGAERDKAMNMVSEDGAKPKGGQVIIKRSKKAEAEKAAEGGEGESDPSTQGATEV